MKDKERTKEEKKVSWVVFEYYHADRACQTRCRHVVSLHCPTDRRPLCGHLDDKAGILEKKRMKSRYPFLETSICSKEQSFSYQDKPDVFLMPAELSRDKCELKPFHSCFYTSPTQKKKH
ncbi:hypothetical protein P5673_011465 [Acropora cervicornis]|uniref:Uncharacterized protein n=1 Tax=Acropora cervicornis TaxID=6130 RepID=A0AAD9QNU8_ACRCE|nr:hypothetical protein P5673_011465 [Acropora cervicornis]